MEDNVTVADVPYIVHESALARAERHIKRLWILVLVLILLLAGSNAGWVWYESQFEDVVLTQEAQTDGGGDVSLNGVGSGEIYFNGEGEADNQGETP